MRLKKRIILIHIFITLSILYLGDSL